MIFSAGYLLKGNSEVTTSEVNVFCDKYSIDAGNVVREMNNFVPVFKENHTVVNMADVSKTLSLTLLA